MGPPARHRRKAYYRAKKVRNTLELKSLDSGPTKTRWDVNNIELINEVLAEQTLECRICPQRCDFREGMVGDTNWQPVNIGDGYQAGIGAVRNEMQFQDPVSYWAAVLKFFEPNWQNPTKSGQMIIYVDL